VIVGLLLGWAASYAVGGMIQSLLFGISPSDIGTRVLLGAALLSLGLIACLIPARRASRVDPMIALRSE
jgi:putative ABC transport system permease protein